MFKYDEMNKELETRFPEFKNEIEEEKKHCGKDELLTYSFYNAVLNFNIKKILKEENKKNINFINNIFIFLEEMASSDDVEVRNLLQVGILEFLWDEKIILEKAEKLMFPKTKEINKKIYSYLKRP